MIDLQTILTNSGLLATADISAGKVFSLMLYADTTLNFVGLEPGDSVTVWVTQTGTFSLNIAGVAWPNDTPPVVTATANTIDGFQIYGVTYGGSLKGSVIGQNYRTS